MTIVTFLQLFPKITNRLIEVLVNKLQSQGISSRRAGSHGSVGRGVAKVSPGLDRKNTIKWPITGKYVAKFEEWMDHIRLRV
jgi:hypothetical protein